MSELSTATPRLVEGLELRFDLLLQDLHLRGPLVGAGDEFRPLQLLGAVAAAADRPALARLPEVVTLRALWEQQYVADGAQPGTWRWRAVDEMPPPGAMLSSPYDPEARYSRKGEATWVG